MGSGREDLDVEGDNVLQKRSHGGKGNQVQPAYPPPQVALMAGQHRRRVFIIPLFVVANVAVLVVTMYVNNCLKKAKETVPNGKCILRWLGRFSFQSLRENPLLGPSSNTLQKMGGLVSVLVTKNGQGWRLMTCTWLHGGVFHLLLNMLGLLLIGIRLEQEFGFLKVTIVYLLSGFGGSIMSALFIRNEISVGASGALFGLLGATVSELLINWTIYANKCLALTTLLLIVVVNLLFGLMPHVDNFAHIGGFVSGFLLGFVFLVKPQYGWVSFRKMPPSYMEGDITVMSKHTCSQYVLWIIAAILLVVSLTVAIALLFTGVDVNKRCTWCHYLSCVPTSLWKCNSNNM